MTVVYPSPLIVRNINESLIVNDGESVSCEIDLQTTVFRNSGNVEF